VPGRALYSIAWQQGLVRQLADMSAIGLPYTIYVGQRCVPPPVTSADGTPAGSGSAAPLPSGRVCRASATECRRAGPSVTTCRPDRRRYRTQTGAPAIVTLGMAGQARWRHAPANGKKGIDIGGKPGQPILSAADGKVVYSGSGLVGYGRLIIIKHNDSLLSAYGHNSELLVAEGDYVKAGQVIAKMGSSGTSSTRLYFEIRQDGKPVNPLRYLPRG
jgi:lipoprotein NlpD